MVVVVVVGSEWWETLIITEDAGEHVVRSEGLTKSSNTASSYIRSGDASK